jgi:hypothetical protein
MLETTLAINGNEKKNSEDFIQQRRKRAAGKEL